MADKVTDMMRELVGNEDSDADGDGDGDAAPPSAILSTADCPTPATATAATAAAAGGASTASSPVGISGSVIGRRASVQVGGVVMAPEQHHLLERMLLRKKGATLRQKVIAVAKMARLCAFAVTFLFRNLYISRVVQVSDSQ